MQAQLTRVILWTVMAAMTQYGYGRVKLMELLGYGGVIDSVGLRMTALEADLAPALPGLCNMGRT